VWAAWSAVWTLGCCSAACAAGPFDRSAALREFDLDQVRGGFDIGSGVVVSFGLERRVEINGSVVASTRFNVPDVARMTAEQAGHAQAALASTVVVRDGTATVVPVQGSAPGTTIQNSLNDQTIRSMTILSVSTNSLSILQSLNGLSTLHDALLIALPKP
jgi:hypothetical protein